MTLTHQERLARQVSNHDIPTQRQGSIFVDGRRRSIRNPLGSLGPTNLDPPASCLLASTVLSRTLCFNWAPYGVTPDALPGPEGHSYAVGILWSLLWPELDLSRPAGRESSP